MGGTRIFDVGGQRGGKTNHVTRKQSILISDLSSSLSLTHSWSSSFHTRSDVTSVCYFLPRVLLWSSAFEQNFTVKSNTCYSVLPEELYGWINQVGSWREEGLFHIMKKKKISGTISSLQIRRKSNRLIPPVFIKALPCTSSVKRLPFSNNPSKLIQA